MIVIKITGFDVETDPPEDEGLPSTSLVGLLDALRPDQRHGLNGLGAALD